MKKYAKLICGALRVPQNYPSFIMLDGKKITNPTEEQWKAAGYLPLIEKEPIQKDGYIAVANYKVKGGKIIQSWTSVKEEETTNAE